MESTLKKDGDGSYARRTVPALLFMLATTNAAALEFGPVLQASLEFGGETLITTSEGDVTSGGLVQLGLGLAIHGYSDADNLETHLSIGMKADSVSGTNGTVSFYRWPVELIQYLKSDNFNFGLGLSYHLNPEEECDVDSQCDYVIKYDNALGYVIAANYVINRGSGSIRETTVGVRYTAIEYQYSDYPWAPAVDGNSIGIALGVAF